MGMENGMSPADLAAVTGGGSGMENTSFFWIFALLILLFGGNGGFGFGNNNGSACSEVTGYEFGQLAGNNATKDNQLNLVDKIDNKACLINEQIHSVGMDLGNGICSLGYETLRNFNATQNKIADLGTHMQDCCCEIQRGIDSVNYNGAINTAAINANTTAQVQKVIDTLCADRTAQLQNRVNQLELQSSLCNVVKYPVYSQPWPCGNNLTSFA